MILEISGDLYTMTVNHELMALLCNQTVDENAEAHRMMLYDWLEERNDPLAARVRELKATNDLERINCLFALLNLFLNRPDVDFKVLNHIFCFTCISNKYARDEKLIRFNEPNRELFIYEGFQCFIHRSTFLTLCGYVAVPTDLNVDDLHVHGGITYDEMGHNCFGVDDRVIGFDCGHHYDGIFYNYKDFNYVRTELKNLVHQIKERL